MSSTRQTLQPNIFVIVGLGVMWPAGTEKKSFCFFAACGGLHPYDQYELVRYPVSADQNHFGHPPSFWVTRPAAQLLRRPQIFTDHGTLRVLSTGTGYFSTQQAARSHLISRICNCNAQCKMEWPSEVTATSCTSRSTSALLTSAKASLLRPPDDSLPLKTGQRSPWDAELPTQRRRNRRRHPPRQPRRR
jgi:hypothetical protein